MLSLTNLINKIGDMLWLPMIQQSTRDQPTIGCYTVNAKHLCCTKMKLFDIEGKTNE